MNMNPFHRALRSAALALLLAAPLAGAQVPQKTYGQELVDQTLAHNPGLRAMLLRAAPPGAADAVVAASNIGRIGTSGHDELELGGGAEPRAVVLPDGHSAAVELPLENLVGEPVGMLVLLWPYRPRTPLSVFIRRAETIRDTLARRILNSANLFDPYPLDPAITTRNRAQKLVDAAQAAQPEIEVLAVRGHVGADGELVLLGSTFGRQGKKADGDDLKVLASTAPNTGIYSDGKRFGVDLALHDRAGAVIGTMNVGYAWHEGADGEALVRHALTLRQRLEAQIAPGQVLDVLDP